MALFEFEERLSDSPFVERIWRTTSDRSDTFTSMALSHWQICVWTSEGKTNLTLRGPETKATTALVPANTEFFGIVFKLGTFMPDLPASQLVDRDFTLPEAAGHYIRLDSSAWELPNYENADVFLRRLALQGLLIRDTTVDAALDGHVIKEMSMRSVQRRFLQTVGITHTTIHQINRARHAMLLLQQGTPILDVVDQAGYFDQPHLTRSFKRYIGITPAQFMAQEEPEQLSYHWEK